ncbi:MAG: DUF4351 domain-containing protein [Gammaproteobacteria bacterium]
MLAERVESWMQDRENKGKKRGEERGKVKGRIDGLTELVMQQIQHKFGTLPLPSTYQKQLQQMTDVELLTLGNLLLEAQTLDDLFSQVA